MARKKPVCEITSSYGGRLTILCQTSNQARNLNKHINERFQDEKIKWKSEIGALDEIVEVSATITEERIANMLYKEFNLGLGKHSGYTKGRK